MDQDNATETSGARRSGRVVRSADFSSEGSDVNMRYAAEKRPRRRQGRGQLSSIDTLPEAADEAIAWANAKLAEREVPQNEILRQFNAMLADHKIAPVSRSAFSRHSVRVAIEMRKANAAREVINAIMARLPKGERGDTTLAAIELVKFRIVEMVMDDKIDDPKSLSQASLTLQRLTSTANNVAEGKRRDDKEQREQTAAEREEAEKQAEREKAETADTVEKIATEAGLSAERVAAIRKGVLGLAG